MLEKGSAAPDFSLVADDDSTVSLADLRGQKVLLYFYPKDDTSGCTAQACDLRDEISFFDGLNVKVLGVSPDSAASHRKFKAKFDLNFPLLVDEDHAVAEAYGVWQEKSMYGRKYMGIERSSFLIDEEGRLIEEWRKVKAKAHAEMLKAYLGD